MQQPNKLAGTLFIQLSIVIGAFLLFCVVFFSKAVSFLWFNFYHNYWLDVFFTYFTYLGDGLVAVLIVVLLLLFKNNKLAGKLFVAFIVSGLAAQVLKKLFHAPRPQSFFHETYHHFITGVTHTGFASFPSGHTTTAFVVATLLACNTRCSKSCIVFFILACLVGYSRIYLGQHFVPDVLAGMVIGISTSMIVENLTLYIKIPKSKQYSAPTQHHEQPALEL